MPITGFVSHCLAVAVAPYVGPGDVVSGATAWWGLRAYSLAKAGSKAINLRALDNATSDFNTLSNGNLDVASISTFQTIHGAPLAIAALYDQTGNGNDLTQPTAANQPSFTLSGLGSLPIMSFVQSFNLFLSNTATWATLSQPFAVSHVTNESTVGSQITLFSDNAVILAGYESAGASTTFIYSGVSVPTATASAGNWHAFQRVFNSAASVIAVDTTQTSVDLGSATGMAAAVYVGDYDGISQAVSADQTEIGVWPIAFSGGQMTSMNSNQKAYWGF